MTEKVKVNVFMSPDMLAALKRMARLRDVSYAEIVRTACRAYIVEHAEKTAQDAQAMRVAAKNT